MASNYAQTSSSSPNLLVSEATILFRAATKDQRDQEIQRLTKKYCLCKSQLDMVISQNVDRLVSIQKMYHRVATNLALAKKKLETIKETLKNCQSWLRVETTADDVLKLFRESRELAHLLEHLQDADTFQKAFNAYNSNIFNHDYVAAAESLLLACSISENNVLFEDAPLLKQLKDSLDKERRKMISCILQGIRETIFMCKFPSRKISMASIHLHPPRNVWAKASQDIQVAEDSEQEEYDKKLRSLVKCYALHGNVSDCYDEILKCLEADLLGLIEQTRKDDDCSFRTNPDVSDHVETVKINLRHFAETARIFDVESSEIASRKFIESADREISSVLAKYVNEANDANVLSDTANQAITKFFLKRTTIKSNLFKFNRSSVFLGRSL